MGIVGLNASERNRRALNRLIREREERETREGVRKYERVIKNPKATYNQRRHAKNQLAKLRSDERELSDRERRTLRDAETWLAYRLNFPDARTRTYENAKAFLDGFGSRGQSGQRNRHGGYVATSTQRTARNTYIKEVTRKAKRLSTGVRTFGAGWWDVWREEYKDAFL